MGRRDWSGQLHMALGPPGEPKGPPSLWDPQRILGTKLLVSWCWGKHSSCRVNHWHLQTHDQAQPQLPDLWMKDTGGMG